MDLDIAKVCKTIATVIVVITAIIATLGASIVAWLTESALTFVIMFVAFGLGGFLLFVLWYALGEVIEILEGVRGGISKTNRLLENGGAVSSNNPTATNVQNGIAGKKTPPSQGGWICKKCNTKNPSNVISCVDCGTYK